MGISFFYQERKISEFFEKKIGQLGSACFHTLMAAG